MGGDAASSSMLVWCVRALRHEGPLTTDFFELLGGEQAGYHWTFVGGKTTYKLSLTSATQTIVNQLYDNSKYLTKSREKASSPKTGPEDCNKHDQMIFKVVNKPTVGDKLTKPLSFQVKLKVRKPIMVELASHCT